MFTRILWILAVACYAGAALLANLGQSAGIDYRFWLLIGAGTMSGVLGNLLHHQARQDDAPHAH